MAYRHQSCLPGQLKVNDPNDKPKNKCLHRYVIELPGVEAEDVKIRVTEGRFLIIEAHGCCKGTVSPLDVDLERIKKRARKEMEENERKHQEKMEEMDKKHRELIKEIDRITQEQPTLRPFANMAGNPFLHPTSYYLLSAFQHAFSGNNTYHQFAAAGHGAGMKNTLPQFDYGVPSSSFPPAAAIPSGHGGYAGSANIPGNFSLNPSTTPASSTTSYDDVMNYNYKDNSHFLPPPQNDNSSVWVHEPTGLITASTYYGIQGQGQGQGQQLGEFRQQYGNLEDPNFYSSQAGVLQEQHQQQQTHNDGSSGPTI